MNRLLLHLLRLHAALTSGLMLALTRLAARRDRRDDRGDVPGWVMIAVMTAGLCTALYAIARSQLSDLLTSALHDVTGGS